MTTNGHAQLLAPRALPAEPVWPTARLPVILQVVNAVLTLACTLVLSVLVFPVLWDVARLLADEREALRKQSEAQTRQAQTAEHAQRQLALQQSALASQQERLKQLTEENVRLAERIRQKLKGDE